MQGIGQLQSGLAMGKRLRDAFSIFDGDLRQGQKVIHDAGNLFGRKFIVSAHYPFKFEQHGLANHQWLA